MSIPDSIKIHKPDVNKYGATEIRCIQNRFYVYEISSRWDAEKHKARKVTGKCIGRITEKDGFLPNAFFLEKYREKSPVVRTFGAFALFEQLGKEVTDRLKASFPDCHREIKTAALLTLVYGCTEKLMEHCFADSYLADLYPDIDICEQTVHSLLTMLGAQREEKILEFLRKFLPDQPMVLIDAASLFLPQPDTDAWGEDLSASGRKEQVRLLYLFEMGSHAPYLYRMVPRNTAVSQAMADMIALSGAPECIILADEKFYSESNIASLKENHLNYILPLPENTEPNAQNFEDALNQKHWDGQFVYGKNIVKYRKKSCQDAGGYLYVFQEETGKNQGEQTTARHTENPGGEGCEEIFPEKRRERFFLSSRDLPAKELFLTYREKWEIYKCFAYFANSLKIGGSFEESREWISGFLFISHVALLYFHSLAQAMRKSGLDQEWKPEEILALSKNIYQIREKGDGQKNMFLLSGISDRDEEIWKALGVDFSHS